MNIQVCIRISVIKLNADFNDFTTFASYASYVIQTNTFKSIVSVSRGGAGAKLRATRPP